ncbi:MAG TPA: NAD(P)H-hydrate dehydratase, partial [Pirellulaceae bacterium]|nr:NAD(P)H-hydrate dehydratase [Pirellulaceae bacterium]
MTDRSPEIVTAIPSLAPRRSDGHKGDYGRALLIGGSRGMSGAIALAGMSALRGGAGLVRLAVPEPCLETVAAFEPSYMTTALPSDSEGRIAAGAIDDLHSLVALATCVACGPGLGRSVQLTALVRMLYRSVAQPLVVDADALNALAADGQGLADHAGPRILTPHPGEFRRLAGSVLSMGRASGDVAAISASAMKAALKDAAAIASAESSAAESSAAEMTDAAIEIARRDSLVIVLKGHRTLVTDGGRAYRNTTGNPGMATGGSGDVLTGLITALVCQSLAPWDAARLGVYLHGLAGDLASRRFGQVSLIASDLVRFLPRAFRSL